MARNGKTTQGDKKSKAVTDGATDAGSSALGFALHAMQNADPEQKSGEIANLVDLCDMAADHMALAHNLIVTHVDHTDTAIDHLDAALGCLKQILADGETVTSAKAPKGSKGARRAKSA